MNATMKATLRTSCGATRAAGSRPAPLLIGSGFTRTALRRIAPSRAQPEQQQQGKGPKLDEDLPPWVRREKERELQAKEGSTGPLPWPLMLLFSIFTAIAAVGSIFEFIDRNAIFGVVGPDSPLWAPILLFFAVTGFPTAGYLFIQGVNQFNAEAERQDKLDGYL